MAIESAIPEKGTPPVKRPRTTAPAKPGTTPAFATSNPGNRATTSTEQNREQMQSTPKGKAESKGPSGPPSMSLVDSELLGCPICFEPLCSPVYQCENGHIDTQEQMFKLLPPNWTHRAIEMVLESALITCQHKEYGCKEMFSYNKRVAHEKACTFVPCCDFVGYYKHLYDHFALEHKDSCKKFNFNFKISITMDTTTQKHVILGEEKEGVLFVLNRCIDSTLGSYFSVVCLAPPASEKIVYDLTAKTGDASIKLKSSVEMISKWIARTPSKMSLVVPTSQPLHLTLIIGKKRLLFHDSDSSDRLLFTRPTAPRS